MDQINRLSPRVGRIISEPQMKEFNQGVIRILAEVGIEVVNEKIKDKLSSYDVVTIKEGRLFFDSDYLATVIEDDRKRKLAERGGEPPLPKRVPIQLGGYSSKYYVDPADGEVKPHTVKSLIDMTRISEGLSVEDIIVAGCPGYPSELPLPLQILTQLLIGVLYSSKPSLTAWAFLPEETQPFYQEFAELLELEDNIGFYMISPLRMIGEGVDLVFDQLDSSSPPESVYVGHMPVVGVSGPVNIFGTLMMGFAERLGGALAVRLYSDGTVKADYGTSAQMFDMANGNQTYGSPELCLAEMLQRDISDYYGNKWWEESTRSLRTMAKLPGINAAIDKSASAVSGTLIGSRSFNAAGLLGMDEIFSPEQAIIDREIADWAWRLNQGVVCDIDHAIKVIKEIQPSADFLTCDDTLMNYRNTYWMPSLLDRQSVKGWFEKPGKGKSILGRANEKVNALLEQHDYLLADPKRSELINIFERACRQIAGHSAKSILGVDLI